MSNHGRRTRRRSPVAVWEDIVDLIAEADDEQLSERDLLWLDHVHARVHGHLRALEHQLASTRPGGITIPPEIDALDHQGLLATLELLRQEGAQFQNKNLAGLSDDELKFMIAWFLRPQRQDPSR